MRVVWLSIVLLPLFGNLTACGFQLRTPVQASSLAGQPMQLGLAESSALHQPLTRELLGLGVQLADNANLTLKISNVVLNRQILNGKLTEVQLSLTAKFQLVDSQTGEPLSTLRSVLARRSYRYDIATVNTERQEEQFFIKVMNEDIAQQIIRQLHTNRLPTAVLDQAPE